MKLYLFLVFIATTSALYSSSDDVVELTDANFKNKVIGGEELWFVEFYAPWCGHCKTLAPEWKKAATALKGIVKVGAVDATEHRSTGSSYNIQGFPTIKIFGANKNSPSEYQGGRTAQAFVDSAISQLKTLANDRLRGGGGGGGGGGGSRSDDKKPGDKKDVIELTDSNFEELVINSDDLWLVEFFAPWCGHCKTLEPEWASAASQLKGKVKLGAVDATVNTIIAGRFGVNGYPTIKSFPAGSKSHDDATEYDGGRTASNIVAWALNKVAENLPPPEVHELTSEARLKDACLEHQVCIIAILPHILDCDSKCRNDFIEILKKQSEKHKKRQWGFLWAEAGSQPDVEQAFNIGGFGYPALSVLNSRKMKYSWLRGSFSEKGVHEFLLEVAVGRSTTEPIRNNQLPPVHETPGWDGKDGELPEEEDIDLSDVELDDLPSEKTEL